MMIGLAYQGNASGLLLFHLSGLMPAPIHERDGDDCGFIFDELAGYI